MKRFAWPILIGLTGLLFIFVIPQENAYIRLVFKLLPMICIIIYAYRNQSTYVSIPHERLILAGLFVCMLGDAFIIFSFILGLAAFLVGHLLYIGAFVRQRRLSSIRLAMILPIIAYGLFFGNKITAAISQSGEKNLILPVILYIAVISLMGWTAILSGNKRAVAGSILFIISDTILSWNLFVSDIPYSSELIMLTYYSAQFLIAGSLLAKRTSLYILPPKSY
ncbi:MAG: lysoplasmalogenase [Bacillus sp. (in: firmicutes)]